MTTDAVPAKDREKIFPSFTELRIYPSVTEIREKFNAPKNFKMYFPRDVYEQIVSGSISIEDIPLISQCRVAKANNLENQTIFVRRHGEEPIECSVVRAQDLLLKDVNTGRFIRGQCHEIEYVQIPEEEGQEVTFALKEAGQATLSYFVHGIRWSARYILNVSSRTHSFEAWADMINSSRRDYKVKHTELFGGDIRLEEPSGYVHELEGRGCCLADCCCSCSPMKSQTKAESHRESSAAYYYSIDQPFVLAQQSTYSLPFTTASVQLDKCAFLEHEFNEETTEGKFQRRYRIESDRFLPAGFLTIREDGRVVGQLELTEVPRGDATNLNCGIDHAVSFARQVRILSRKRDSARYLVDLTVKNAKTQPVKYDYREAIHAVKFEVMVKSGSQSTDNKIEINGQGLAIVSQQLEAKAQESFQYEILVEHEVRNEPAEPVSPKESS